MTLDSGPPEVHRSRVVASRLLAGAAYAVFAMLLVLNVHFLAKHAVDIPYFDDWDQYFLFVDGMTVSEFLSVHNEHRILLTRLQTWVLVKLTGWNIYLAQMMNLTIYLGGIVGLIFFLRRRTATLPAWVLAAFALFALSPRIYENHLWAFQSQFHFAWILCFAVIALLLRPGHALRHAAWAALCAIVATLSFSGALAGAALASVAYAVERMVTWRASASTQARRAVVASGLAFLVPTWSVMAVCVALYKQPDFHPSVTSPLSPAFWWYLGNLVSNGFGVNTVSRVWAVICCALVAVPLAGLLWRRDDLSRWETRGVCCALIATVGILAGIAGGRAAWSIDSSKASRYAEFAGLLPVLVAATWAHFLRERRQRATVLAVLWLFCAVAYADDWNFEELYAPVSESRRAGLACVERYYYQGGDGICTDIWWPESMGPMLEDSRRMRLSFYRRLERAHSPRGEAEAAP